LRSETKMHTLVIKVPSSTLLPLFALLVGGATGLARPTAPVTLKEAANGIRDGLQAALRSRHSRLSIELPPGTRLGVPPVQQPRLVFS